MREGYGSVFLYNLVILFILIAFAFIAATMSYAKAFRVNSRMTKELERFEGWNELSEPEVTNILNTLGYRKGSDRCPPRKGNAILVTYGPEKQHDFCLYVEGVDGRHYRIGVMTYIFIDLPLVREFKVPIYAKTDRIFMFDTGSDVNKLISIWNGKYLRK
jgi:hypothetical protein